MSRILNKGGVKKSLSHQNIILCHLLYLRNILVYKITNENIGILYPYSYNLAYLPCMPLPYITTLPSACNNSYILLIYNFIVLFQISYCTFHE